MRRENNRHKNTPIFISKERKFIVGDEAQKEIEKHNDAIYFRRDKGVMFVSKERWEEAQYFEKSTWMVDNLRASNDSNTLYEKHFDNYRQISGMRFDNAIELGCGPFTNMRIIARHTDIGRVHLLDPLINDYLSHPNCFYNGGCLMVPLIQFENWGGGLTAF
jgi:hypothetical protein